VITTLPNNWRPRGYQLPFWRYMENGGKRAVICWHRRSGKDDCCLHFSATDSMQSIGNYWHMLPEYKQARKVVWDAINPKTGKRRIDEAFPPSIRKATRKHEMQIELISGSIWQLVGAENFDSYMGSPPRGIVFSEWSLSNPMCWPYIMPILEENGGWAVFNFTMRGYLNHGTQMLNFAMNKPDWFAQKLSVDDTPIFTKDQLERIRDELIALHGQDHGEALFMQEYYCSSEASVLGAIYAKQLEIARKDKRICNVPHDTGLEVDTFWDLGMDDSTTIWFIQSTGREHRIIDYYECSGQGLAHYAKIIKEKPYVYGEHYMPHDASVRELGTGKSRKDTAEELGIRPVRIVKRARDAQAVRNGIEAGRNILSRCWFDEKKCANGLIALDGYHYEYDEEAKKLKDTPAHTFHSHGSDAWRTFAVGFQPKISHKPVSRIMRENIIQGGWGS
jgi:hypothetical protein